MAMVEGLFYSPTTVRDSILTLLRVPLVTLSHGGCPESAVLRTRFWKAMRFYPIALVVNQHSPQDGGESSPTIRPQLFWRQFPSCVKKLVHSANPPLVTLPEEVRETSGLRWIGDSCDGAGCSSARDETMADHLPDLLLFPHSFPSP
jgi:hypothetical protein